MLSVGYLGVLEYKIDEKRNYIGEFREKVLLALTKEKVGKKGILSYDRKSFKG